MAVDLQALDTALLGAHAAGDVAVLARLYGQAADRADAAGDRPRAAFFLTQAYVYALECGAAEAAGFRARLAGWGREDGHAPV